VDEDLPELTAVVDALRKQLAKAVDATPAIGLRFEVTQAQAQFQVVVTKTGGGTGGLSLGVVNLGATDTRSRAETHTVSLTLQPFTMHADGSRTPTDIAGHFEGSPG